MFNFLFTWIQSKLNQPNPIQSSQPKPQFIKDLLYDSGLDSAATRTDVNGLCPQSVPNQQVEKV